MGDPADIRFVDTHAKGHRGDNDQPIFALKPHLGVAPFFGIHAPMVMQRQMSRIAQRLCKGFGFGARATIDNARLPFARRCELQNLSPGAVFCGKGQMNVGPVKPVQKHLWRFVIKQPTNDFFAGFRVGCGCKGGNRHIQRAAQVADAQIVRPKIMPPLADAMGFVDSNHTDANAPQHAHGSTRGQSFWRDVQKFQTPGF